MISSVLSVPSCRPFPGFLSRYLSRRTLLADRFLYSRPSSLGLETEEVAFWARGGVKLRGWFLRGRKPGVVVFCPGNSGNASSHLEYVRVLSRTGYSALLFDYRGFGRSDGAPDLGSVVHDVEAACELAVYHGGEPFALFGVSLGANAALAAAGRAASGAAGVAAEGVSDAREMLRGLFAGGAFGPTRVRGLGGLDGGLTERRRPRLVRLRMPGLLAGLAAAAGTAFYPFEAKSLGLLAAGLRSKPVLLIHGVEDQLLPFEAAVDFHERLEGPRRLWLIPGTGHAQEPVLARGAEYAAQLEGFLDEAFSGRLQDMPAVRVSEIHAHHPARGLVSARLGLDSAAGAREPEGRVLLSVSGGGVLRQALLEGAGEVDLDFPGPIDGVATLRLGGEVEDPVSKRYTAGGYREVFRELVLAVNSRDLEALDQALGSYMRLERGAPFDFVAALYGVRAAQAALGLVPGWRASDRAVARRSLERLLELWRADAALPAEDVPESPAAWARALLEEVAP